MHSEGGARKNRSPQEGARDLSPPQRRAPAGGVAGWRRRGASLLDYLAVDRVRRRRAAIGLAILLNALLFAALAVFGRFHIFIPSAPSDSIIMVDLNADFAPPTLIKPETAPEPEDEAEPEPVEDPALEPEPAPDPVPDATPEVAPDPAPAEEEAAAGEPKPAPRPGAEAAPSAGPDGAQSPARPAPPLVARQPASPAEREGAEDGEEKGEEKEPVNDDMFDHAPAYGRPLRPLPTVDLPEGDIAIAPGRSGVVAIFCPEEFSDREKAAECAGRTEIRSGWRPGVGREDWSEAVRLLKKDRLAGRAGADPAVVGPASVEALEAAAAEGLETLRSADTASREGGGVGAAGGDSADTLNRGLGRPDIGPAEVEPPWARPDDPLVSREEAEKLRRALEEAEDRKSAPETED